SRLHHPGQVAGRLAKGGAPRDRSFVLRTGAVAVRPERLSPQPRLVSRPLGQLNGGFRRRPGFFSARPAAVVPPARRASVRPRRGAASFVARSGARVKLAPASPPSTANNPPRAGQNAASASAHAPARRRNCVAARETARSVRP